MQLSSFGIQPESIRFQSVSLQSEKYLSVQEVRNDQPHLSIIDLETRESSSFNSIKADSAIMHPAQNLVALRGNGAIQIMNLGERRRLSTVPFAEPVSYWGWLDASTIAVVSEREVFHLSNALSEKPSLQRVCARHEQLRNAQIMSYSVSADRKWTCLVAMVRTETGIAGKAQLYFKDRDASQMLDATAARFCPLVVGGNTISLLSYVNGAKLTLLDVGPKGPDGATQSGLTRVELDLPIGNDIALGIVADPRYGMLHITTKTGSMHTVDVSGTLLFSGPAANQPLLAAVPAPTGGFIGVTAGGSIVTITPDPQTIIPHVRQAHGNDMAARIAFRCPWVTGARQVLETQFQTLFQSGQYKQAAELVLETGTDGLRTRQTLQLFQTATAAPGQPAPMLVYFQTLMADRNGQPGALLDFESVEIARPMVEQGKTAVLEQWIAKETITCSEQLGNMMEAGSTLALTVYLKAGVHTKVVDILTDRGEFDKAMAYSAKVGHTIDPPRLLERVIQASGPVHAVAARIVTDGMMPVGDVIDRLVASHNVKEATALLDMPGVDEDITFRYIEAAVRLGHLQEVERVVRTASTIDPRRVATLLMQSDLSTTLPLVSVCDRFDMVPDLVEFLYQRKMRRAIENYVTTFNTARAPQVVATLLDIEAEEAYIGELCVQVADRSDLVPELINITSERNRLTILRDMLDSRVAGGCTDTESHSALAQILIAAGDKELAQHFLRTNGHYDHMVVGNYCAKRDPHLAILAYSTSPDHTCDLRLVEVANDNALFKHQSRYLVERMNDALWASVLAESNPHRADVIGQVIQSLPDGATPEQVSCTVKAFMKADIPAQLIALLEKIVLEAHSAEFATHSSLQNLLILTAIKMGDEDKILGYIQVLANYDGAEMAGIATDTGLYRVGFAIYAKFNLAVEAINVIITHQNDIPAAQAYAKQANDPKVWSVLAAAELEAGLVTNAVESYITAKDARAFDAVVAATRPDHLTDLQHYLEMARGQVRDTAVDTELCHVLAQTDQLDSLEELLAGPNVARLQSVGEACFAEELYPAARIVFTSITNHGWLAETYLKLENYTEAVAAAQRAASIKTWRSVCRTCVDAGEFDQAAICGHQLMVNSDELGDLIDYYEAAERVTELIELLETGIAAKRVTIEVLTALGEMYSRYNRDKLLDHLKAHVDQMNIAKLIRTCKAHEQWIELVFLYGHYDEYDNAAIVCIEHAEESWTAQRFLLILGNVTRADVILRAVKFYLAEHDDLTCELLAVVGERVDQGKIIALAEDAEKLPTIRSYLDSIAEADIDVVNVARHKLLIEAGDHDELRASATERTNYDRAALADELQDHADIEFRRVGIALRAILHQWPECIDLCLRDGLYSLAVDNVEVAKSSDAAERLLGWLAGDEPLVTVGGDPLPTEEGVAVRDETVKDLLERCSDLVRPHVALQYMWQARMVDVMMPFMVKTVLKYTTKVAELEAKVEGMAQGAPAPVVRQDTEQAAFGFFQAADGQ